MFIHSETTLLQTL